MLFYHENKEKTMRIFPTMGQARINRRENEVTIPFGSRYGIQRWVNIPLSEYVCAKYVRIS